MKTITINSIDCNASAGILFREQSLRETEQQRAQNLSVSHTQVKETSEGYPTVVLRIHVTYTSIVISKLSWQKCIKPWYFGFNLFSMLQSLCVSILGVIWCFNAIFFWYHCGKSLLWHAQDFLCSHTNTHFIQITTPQWFLCSLTQFFLYLLLQRQKHLTS